jgi:hypothetical protein
MPSSVAANEAQGEKLELHEINSKLHTIDRTYASMKGPTDTQHFQFDAGSEPELIWLKSAQVAIVDTQGEPMSSEFLCHSNLYFSEYRRHFELMDRSTTANQRFIDINQGLLELRLPDGFGIPMMSNETLNFHSMVFNIDSKPETFDVRVKTNFEYLRDSERTGSIKALAQRSISILVPAADPDAHAHVQGCGHDLTDSTSEHEGHTEHAGNTKKEHQGHEGHQGHEELNVPANPQKRARESADGVNRTVHWIVPPGRHEYRFQPKRGLRIPYPETTVHLLTGHMHAYGESIELRDVTTGEALFRANAKAFDSATGIEHMTHYSSEGGFPVHQDHQYELIATYNNTTSQGVDAMAVLYLYYLDKKLDEQAIDAIRGRQQGVAVSSRHAP